MIEIRAIERSSIPGSHWKEELETRLEMVQNGRALMIILPRLQPYKPILNAFYKLAIRRGRKARTKKISTEVGTTLFLWMK